MMKLTIKGKEYKVKFGYNCFCDTDLMDRVQDLMKLFKDEGVENDADISALGKVKDLFLAVRDLMFVGFKKYNPLEKVEDVGDLLDDYIDEPVAEGEEPKGIISLFTDLSGELLNEGFLSELMKGANEDMKDGAKAPTDRKQKQK